MHEITCLICDGAASSKVHVDGVHSVACPDCRYYLVTRDASARLKQMDAVQRSQALARAKRRAGIDDETTINLADIHGV